MLSSGQTVESDFSALDGWPEARFRTRSGPTLQLPHVARSVFVEAVTATRDHYRIRALMLDQCVPELPIPRNQILCHGILARGQFLWIPGNQPLPKLLVAVADWRFVGQNISGRNAITA